MGIHSKAQALPLDCYDNVVEFPGREIGSSADYSDFTGDADGDILPEILIRESARLKLEAARIENKRARGRPKKHRKASPARQPFSFFAERIKAIPNDLTKTAKAQGATLPTGALRGWRAAQQAARETVNRDKDQTRASAALHSALLDDIIRKDGFCRNSVSFYAKRLGVDIRTAERAFALLVDTGVIVREERRTRAGNYMESRTTLVSLVRAAFGDDGFSAGTSADAGRVPADLPEGVPALKPEEVPAPMPDNTSPTVEPLSKRPSNEPRIEREGSPNGSPATTKKSSQTKMGATSLASDWKLPQDWRTEALDTLEITESKIDTEARKFHDWYLKKGIPQPDWHDAWLRWLRKNYSPRKPKPWWTDSLEVDRRRAEPGWLDWWRDGIRRLIESGENWDSRNLGPDPHWHTPIVPDSIIREFSLKERFGCGGLVNRRWLEREAQRERWLQQEADRSRLTAPAAHR